MVSALSVGALMAYRIEIVAMIQAGTEAEALRRLIDDLRVHARRSEQHQLAVPYDDFPPGFPGTDLDLTVKAV